MVSLNSLFFLLYLFIYSVVVMIMPIWLQYFHVQRMCVFTNIFVRQCPMLLWSNTECGFCSVYNLDQQQDIRVVVYYVCACQANNQNCWGVVIVTYDFWCLHFFQAKEICSGIRLLDLHGNSLYTNTWYKS